MTISGGYATEPNVTPMIDVLLVLLIVFMTAIVPQMHRSLDAQLPCAEACPASGDGIVLEVLPGPAYRINRTVVAPDRLLSQLQSIYAKRPDKIIEIAGHAGVRYEDV